MRLEHVEVVDERRAVLVHAHAVDARGLRRYVLAQVLARSSPTDKYTLVAGTIESDLFLDD